MKETIFSKSSTVSSEFDQLQHLNSTQLKIDTIDCAFNSSDEIKQLLEQRIENVVTPIVHTLLADSINSTNQLSLAIENIAKKIPMVQIQHYFRAGKNYFTINHQMGYAGNIFFKTIFDILLKENHEKSYQIMHKNSFCVIWRN